MKTPYCINGRWFCKCGKQITRPLGSNEIIVTSNIDKKLCKKCEMKP